MFENFFQSGPLPTNALVGHYNFTLVALSYLIAIVASYVALDMAGRLQAEQNRFRIFYWLSGGAFAMGAGIWSMHFIGMLAFALPMPMYYEPLLTALSMVVAIGASGLALFLVRAQKYNQIYVIAGGFFMGLGIATMHYTGMAAMLKEVNIRYLPGIFFLSILIAIIASEAALWLSLKSNAGSIKQQLQLKIISALIMGAAICGMHYTGIAAAIFTPTLCITNGSCIITDLINPVLLSFFIAITTLLIMATALITSTTRQIMERELEKERKFLKLLLNNLTEGIIACDLNYNLTIINPEALKFHNLTSCVSTNDLQQYCHYYHLDGETLLSDNEMPLYLALHGKKIHEMDVILIPTNEQQKTYHLKIDGQIIKNTQGEKIGAVIVMHDITQQKQLEQQLIMETTHDTLTHLLNRNVLYDRLQQAISHAKRTHQLISVLYLDLDLLKNINEGLGYSVGDNLLVEVAKRIQNCIKENDTLARMGSDEFVVILTERINNQAVISIAEKILLSLAHPFQINNKDILITGSIGISCFPKDGEDAETLIKNADAAMFNAKNSGRNNFKYYAAEMNAFASYRLSLERQLHYALDRHELILYYQPIISLKEKRIIAAEALVRWQLPNVGLINPTDFIPLAEESGLIIPIGEWILQEACMQNKKWQKMGLPSINIAVNLSSIQFKSDRSMEVLVKAVLEETKLNPKYLDLEITEGVVLENSNYILDCLQCLKAMGVSLVIDDYGTGYSSFSYLKKFTFDKLKIDKSFIDGIATNTEDTNIVLAIIALANSLKVRIIAEGVETENQLNFLQLHHCDEIQGYYFSQPITAGAFEQLLRKPDELLVKLNKLS